MKPFEWPDTFHLNAAEGWFRLGDYVEANAELDNITPSLRAHPEILRRRWLIYAEAGSWPTAAEIANVLVQLEPQDVLNWLNRSFALHELKRTQEARDQLLPAAEQFPADDQVRYNLACYECQLGNLAEARRWIAAAFALGDARQTKLDALDDPDLEPLWKHIGEL